MSISASGFIPPATTGDAGLQPPKIEPPELRPPEPVAPQPTENTNSSPAGLNRNGKEEGDSVSISNEARNRASAGERPERPDSPSQSEVVKEAREGEGKTDPGELTEGEQDLVDRLKDRDAEVRAHELAHLRAAGDLANGGPKYDYQTGPDGKRYAIGGSVSIDTSKVPNDPQATLEKADRIKRAALAPAEPSGQDRKVAAKADQLKVEARKEIQEEQLEESRIEKQEPEEQTGDSGETQENSETPEIGAAIVDTSPGNTEDEPTGRQFENNATQSIGTSSAIAGGIDQAVNNLYNIQGGASETNRTGSTLSLIA
ncbi:MAG: putative metalloprotease CJM1_0395 family protein [Acidobacteriota bacterium]|nr:putative metalloprotease CJM1_0395 family protein [Acidobacteriota bacterium]